MCVSQGIKKKCLVQVTFQLSNNYLNKYKSWRFLIKLKWPMSAWTPLEITVSQGFHLVGDRADMSPPPLLMQRRTEYVMSPPVFGTFLIYTWYFYLLKGIIHWQNYLHIWSYKLRCFWHIFSPSLSRAKWHPCCVLVCVWSCIFQ